MLPLSSAVVRFLLTEIRYRIVSYRFTTKRCRSMLAKESASNGACRRGVMDRAASPEGREAATHRGRQLDASRDAALRDAALELLAEIGYDRLSIDAVAARAKASKMTIYRRWSG